MKKQRFLACLLILVLMLAVLASCGKASNDALYSENDYAGKGEDAGFVSDKEYVSDTVESPESGGTLKYDEKIIKTVSMSAETRDYDRAFAEIRSLVARFGGYEESVKSTGRSYDSADRYTRTAYLVVRIPAEQLDAFLNQVGTMVNVTSEYATVSNVTAQYYDMQARLEVLETEKEAYEEMLKKSEDVSYLLKIRDRLYDVIEEIESYKTRLALLDQKVAYSTVTVDLHEVIEYTEKPIKDPTFGERIGKAFAESWESFADGCQNLAVWFVGAIPTILVLAVISAGAVGFFLLFRKRMRAHAKKGERDNDPNS